jgi:hypothetical protein
MNGFSGFNDWRGWKNFLFISVKKMALKTHPAKVYQAFFHRNKTVKAFS